MNVLHAVNGLDDFRRDTDDEGIRRDDLIFQNKRTGSDDGTAADLGTCQNSRMHADEDMILNGTGMDAGAVPDSDIIANDAGIVIRHMQTDQILYIRTFTDGDVVHIASGHDARPYTRILSDPNIAGKEYLRSHKRIRIDLRDFSVKFFIGKSIHMKDLPSHTHRLFPICIILRKASVWGLNFSKKEKIRG